MRNSQPHSDNLNIVKDTLPPLAEISTLVDLLRYRAQRRPDQRAYTFLLDGETEQTHITYSQLDRQARAIAAWLQGRGLSGERVLLLYPPGLEYISAFFGCLYAGCVAVPAYPPRLNRPMPRLQALAADAQATAALTTSPILDGLARRSAHAPALSALLWQATDTLPDDFAAQWQLPTLNGNNLAFLQYTSGSTAAPRGVMVSHANLLHNERLIQQAFELTAEDVILGWLPLYHDMGLIGTVLQPLYLGAECFLMSPLAFLQKPRRWLQAITTYQATVSGGPNFAYDLCVRKIPPEQRTGLDLSRWSIAFNGAEPVKAGTLNAFVDAFAPYGFRRPAFYPCYGLAEATLLVSGGNRAETPPTHTIRSGALAQGQVIPATQTEQGRTLVGCGLALGGQQILIADPDTQLRCPPGQIGEIWLAGPSVAEGYWNNPAATEQTFGAHLADTGEGPFLRTGDLGFLHQGQLYITGRLKDLIIIRGRNYYPQDIEVTAEESHPALRPGCGAAFTVELNGQERLVVVQEVQRHYREPDVDEVSQAIRGAVAEEHGLQIYAVVLLKTGTIPKTSSGKIQRHACRDDFVAGRLEAVGRSVLSDSYFDWSEDGLVQLRDAYAPPRTPTEEMLAQIWADVLGLEQAGIHQNFFEWGGHSLLATQAISRVRDAFQVELPLRALFESPTVAGLAKQVEAARQAAQVVPIPPITPVSRDQELPLSFSQERMWFLNQFEPTGAAYNIPMAIRLTGPLNVTALAQSFNQVARRHEALRTTFPTVAGRPVQVIAPELLLELPVVNLQHLPPGRREAEARQRATAQAQKPFDMAAGPLLRLALFRLDANDHVLLVNMHHIISDAWSVSLLWQELTSLYLSFSTGESPQLPPLPVQYADFANWQRQWLRGDILAGQLAYWQRQLAGAPLILELPTDRPRPTRRTYRGAAQTLPLPKPLLEALRVLSRQEDATLFMLLLAAFKLLLYRYTGQPDILVGTPIANRHWLAIEGLIGTFVNTLVLRSNLAGNPTFLQLLKQVRDTALDAYAHQDLPFEQLVEALQPNRELSHTPLVQVTFNVINTPLPLAQLPDLTWRVFEFDRGASQFDLTLSLVDTPQVQLMAMEYNTDLFDSSTIDRLLGQFKHLLEAIIANPEQRLSDLPLLTDAERQRLLVNWNNTSAALPPPDLALHHLFEAQAERTPNAVAVVFEERQLTYRDLNHRANQLAHYLQSLGVGPETLVGLCVERSIEMVVGLLGILKAGAAYVPLDPEYPPERLAFMLNDAGAPVLLTQERLLPRLPSHQSRAICLDTDWSRIASQSVASPNIKTGGDHLAYIIYTSGSTGRPKGAMISHRAICNHMLWMQSALPLSETDRVLQKTPFSFDASVWEFYAPLMTGARLVMAPPGAHQDSAYLVSLIAQQQITILQLVPSLLEAILDEAGIGECHHLRRVFCGGEALPVALQARFFSRLKAHLYNLYGPAEATIDTTCWACRPDDSRASVSIGRPIANAQVYLLDAYLQPVPVGVPGDLYIGGAGLGRGYLNRPELTAEKFIPHPFATQPGARLYKSGDLGRYLPDGSIEFLGRVDQQVKLRGFRIEPGEIESVLGQHPAVKKAAVIVRENSSQDKRLVAYIIPTPKNLASAGELAGFLQDKLPDYMVPSAFVMVDALPLSPSGKLNRAALPEPDRSHLLVDGAPLLARTPTEELLTRIWGQVLRLEQVGVHDNFFDLGGHSLLAVQVFARIEQELGLSLPVATLFQAPTIARLAQLIRQNNADTPASSLVAIQPQGAKPPFFCVHGLGGGVLDYADLARYLGPEQPFYGLQERALTTNQDPFAAIEEMAAHYIHQIQTLQPNGPYFIGGYCYGGTVAFEMARQLRAMGQPVALLAIMDHSPPNVNFQLSPWNPVFWGRFLKNLPYWLHDFMQLNPTQMLARIRRKTRVLGQNLLKSGRPAGYEPTQADLEAVIDKDLALIPPKHHPLLKAHYQAMSNYIPQPYQGQVTLFRTHRHSLFGPFDPNMGWDRLVSGGIEIKEIKGFHANILQEPYVQILAEQLKASLEQAQTREFNN